ncbi:hypothetical protein NQ317_005634 [Molorchus minor]|uniref:Uncharacterized protein n=1 Tax=Molorchus minor TaxID=1323400 RepID=A0ABQ9K6V6_9CUCU|nr:hypothetical protein NQ317_005634 [Molorchus minor]
MVYILQSPSGGNSSDRFIPRRANVDFDFSYYLINKSRERPTTNPFKRPEPSSFVNTAKYFYNLNQYRSALRKSMVPDTDRVLTFSSPKRDKTEEWRKDPDNTSSWPVRPRTRPLLDTPSIILDMPDLDTNMWHHVVDWGKKGYIGTIYEGEVHLWHPEEKLTRHITETGERVCSCIKWNRDGTHLAMALTFSAICIWDCIKNKMADVIACRCRSAKCRQVTAFEWTINNCLLTGCSAGRLTSYSRDFVCIKSFYMAHASHIVNIKASCHGNYIVTSGQDHSVRIWKWPEFIEYFEIEISILRSPIKSVDWHPWRDTLLAIGGPRYTTLWNVGTQKQVKIKPHPHSRSLLDALSFNPLSGELVVSYYSHCYGSRGVHFLTVLKDLDVIVDEAQYHFGRVPYLLWDAQGTKLATASADENLCIWDFFGSADVERKYLRPSTKQFSSNTMKSLNLFNCCIR